MSKVERGTISAQPVLSVRFHTRPEEFGPTLAKVFPAVFAYAGANGYEVAGMPFSRYHDHDESKGEFEIEAGIPVTVVRSPIAVSLEDIGEMSSGELPGGPAVTLMHKGPYEGLGESHEALAVWLEESDVEPAGPPWEVYLTDPDEVDDPADWQTLLVQPVAG